MKFVRWGVVVCLLGLLGYGVYGIFLQRRGIERDLNALVSEKQRITEENAAYEAKIRYYEQPENLLKKAREQYNVKGAGESMLIVVTTATSTASSTPSSTAR
jgi:cell division protein FtsB